MTCPTNRTPYACRKLSKVAAKARNATGGSKMREYKCKVCPAWHIGYVNK